MRTLCDIARGTFVCNYVGMLHSDEQINDKNNNKQDDEYFVELDFIEKSEKLKEGYENEVLNDDFKGIK